MVKINACLVGGAVRDKLLNLEVKECDWVVVGATEKDMLEQGFIKVGRGFPVFLHPQTKEEYALARKERKTSKGYYGFECDFSSEVSLEEDLKRRDLTINAIALTDNGEYIDPFGGKEDLKNKLLRHVSPAFSEDPVRILRVARFAARFSYLGFKVAKTTVDLMKELVVSGEVESLIPERVWKEFMLALGERNPEEFIKVLKECGALKIIFPELDCLWEVPQDRKHHPEINTGEHILLSLQEAVKLTCDNKVRFAVLCHDLGKGVTDKALWPKHDIHEEKGVELIRNWCNKYRVPKSYVDLTVLVSKYHLRINNACTLTAEKLLGLLTELDSIRNEERFDQILLACAADKHGREGYTDSAYFQMEYLKQALQVIKGVSIQQIATDKISGLEIAKKIKKLRLFALNEMILKKTGQR